VQQRFDLGYDAASSTHKRTLSDASTGAAVHSYGYRYDDAGQSSARAARCRPPAGHLNALNQQLTIGGGGLAIF